MEKAGTTTFYVVKNSKGQFRSMYNDGWTFAISKADIFCAKGAKNCVKKYSTAKLKLTVAKYVQVISYHDVTAK